MVVCARFGNVEVNVEQFVCRAWPKAVPSKTDAGFAGVYFQSIGSPCKYCQRETSIFKIWNFEIMKRSELRLWLSLFMSKSTRIYPGLHVRKVSICSFISSKSQPHHLADMVCILFRYITKPAEASIDSWRRTPTPQQMYLRVVLSFLVLSQLLGTSGSTVVERSVASICFHVQYVSGHQRHPWSFCPAKWVERALGSGWRAMELFGWTPNQWGLESWSRRQQVCFACRDLCDRSRRGLEIPQNGR